MLTHRNAPPPDRQALEEAANWLIRLSEGELSDPERAEWDCWKASTPERGRAWARAQLLQGKLGGLPPSLAMSALDRPSSPERRAALGKLAMILAILPVGWASWKLAESRQWSADYRTAVGQRRELTLADGSKITLNTDTAIDGAVRHQPTPPAPARRRNTGADRAWTIHRRPGLSWSAPARAACKRWARASPFANCNHALALPSWKAL